jgi:hypothetical protein
LLPAIKKPELRPDSFTDSVQIAPCQHRHGAGSKGGDRQFRRR